MEESLFRKNSVEHISSPEQLNDYLRVTSPAIWVVLIAVIILLAGVGETDKIEFESCSEL